MAVCDAHEAAWGEPGSLPDGEGYLLAARFMQNSVVQQKNIDKQMRLYEKLGMPMNREQCKAQIESIQGASGWMICEKCVDLLGLGPADKAAAREVAKKCWKDKSTPPHMPAQGGAQQSKKPAYIMVFGNGFQPSQQQAIPLARMWLDNVKGKLGSVSLDGMRVELVSRPRADRQVFIRVVSEVAASHPGQATDDILMLDRRTGQDMALVAVWAPEDSPLVRQLLGKESPPAAPAKPAPAAAGPQATQATAHGPRLITCCPACNTKYEIRESHIGKRARCRKCGAGFEIVLADGSQAGGQVRGNEPPSGRAAPGDEGKEMPTTCVCHACAHCGVEMESPAGTSEREVVCPSCNKQGTVPAVPREMLDLGRSAKSGILVIVLCRFPEKPELVEEQVPALMQRCARKVAKDVVSRFKGRLEKVHGTCVNPRTRLVWFGWPLADPISREGIKSVTRNLWQDETTGSSLAERVGAVTATNQDHGCERPREATADRKGYPDLVLFLTERTPPCGEAAFLMYAVKALFPGAVGVKINVKVEVVGESFGDEGCIATRAWATAAQSGFELDRDRLTHRTFTTADGVNATAVSMHRKK